MYSLSGAAWRPDRSREGTLTAPLAFEVAIFGEDRNPKGIYDPDQQQFVWEGDGEVSLGWPLCTSTCDPAGCSCYTTSTACYYRVSCGLGECGYRCDYG